MLIGVNTRVVEGERTPRGRRPGRRNSLDVFGFDPPNRSVQKDVFKGEESGSEPRFPRDPTTRFDTVLSVDECVRSVEQEK